jgi:hypothetical protein
MQLASCIVLPRAYVSKIYERARGHSSKRRRKDLIGGWGGHTCIASATLASNRLNRSLATILARYMFDRCMFDRDRCFVAFFYCPPCILKVKATFRGRGFPIGPVFSPMFCSCALFSMTFNQNKTNLAWFGVPY